MVFDRNDSLRLSARTPEQLGTLRVMSIEDNGPCPSSGFTCDECTYADVCPYVYDWYNTDGDCLMEK